MKDPISRRSVLTAMSGVAIAAALTIPVLPGAASAKVLKDARITQVRNATLLVEYGGVRFLVDPMLADKGAYPGFPGTAHSELRNPMVDLPVAVEELAKADAVIVTHLHLDHWDDAAKRGLPKSIPIFAQNDDDAAAIRNDGFSDVRVLSDTSEFNGVKLFKTAGTHGPDEIVDVLGEVCGVVFSHPEYRTLYLAGDTIWNHHVEEAIAKHNPEVIVLNTGFAVLINLVPIIMGQTDVLAVHKAAPSATLVATHMEAVNHCILSRADLRDFAEKNGFLQKLLLPSDGETIVV